MDYVDLFVSISNKSKYSKWYESLMRVAAARVAPAVGEKHHIIPRSFNLGGDTAKANIVKLSGREHFVAHRLLHRSISEASLKKKALFAVFMMTTRMTISPTVAGKTREAVSVAMQELWTDKAYRKRGVEATRKLWQSEDFRGKQSKAAETKYATNEYKLKRSELTKKQMKDPMQRATAIRTLAEAQRKIDHSTEDWVGRSFRSKAAVEKHLEVTKSDIFRGACREREMLKTNDQRKSFATVGAHALRSKFESDNEYKKYLSDRIKGRVKIVNTENFEVRVVRPDDIAEGWVLYKTLSPEQQSAVKQAKTSPC